MLMSLCIKTGIWSFVRHCFTVSVVSKFWILINPCHISPLIKKGLWSVKGIPISRAFLIIKDCTKTISCTKTLSAFLNHCQMCPWQDPKRHLVSDVWRLLFVQQTVAVQARYFFAYCELWCFAESPSSLLLWCNSKARREVGICHYTEIPDERFYTCNCPSQVVPEV